MKNIKNEQVKTFEPPLVTVDDFISHHHPPISVRWAIQRYNSELVREKVIVRYGKKILIRPEKFWDWLVSRKGELV